MLQLHVLIMLFASKKELVLQRMIERRLSYILKQHFLEMNLACKK